MNADKNKTLVIRVHPWLKSLIPQRPPALQRESNSLLSLFLPAKREERLPFQIQQILLAHQGARRDRPAAQHVCHPIRHLCVVVADEFALTHDVDPEFQGGQHILARRRNIRPPPVRGPTAWRRSAGARDSW